MKDISKRWGSSLELNDQDLPGLKEMEVGTKHRFTIEAEFTSLRKNEQYDDMDMPMIAGMKKVKRPAQPKFSGNFKITGIEMEKAPKTKKTARYSS